MTSANDRKALIIGASRGSGYALAAEYLARGWQVVATVRGLARTELHALAESSDGRLTVDTLDITVPEQIANRLVPGSPLVTIVVPRLTGRGIA